MPSPTVKILNPVPGGASHLSLDRAQRYARNGRLSFVSAHTARFAETHHAHVSASAAALKTDYERQTNYDRIHRMMTREEIRGIPVILIR